MLICSAPLYVISSIILGVRPGDQGFRVAEVNPAPKLVEVARGTVTTPYGPIMVSWSPSASSTEQSQSRRILLGVEAPKDILVKLPSSLPLKFRGVFEEGIELV